MRCCRIAIQFAKMFLFIRNIRQNRSKHDLQYDERSIVSRENTDAITQNAMQYILLK